MNAHTSIPTSDQAKRRQSMLNFRAREVLGLLGVPATEWAMGKILPVLTEIDRKARADGAKSETVAA